MKCEYCDEPYENHPMIGPAGTPRDTRDCQIRMLLSNLSHLRVAALELREAQRAYMAKRGDEALGRAVAAAAVRLDEVLEYGHSERTITQDKLIELLKIANDDRSSALLKLDALESRLDKIHKLMLGPHKMPTTHDEGLTTLSAILAQIMELSRP